MRDKLTKEGYDVVMEEGRVGDLPSYRIIIHYTGPLEFTYQAGAFVDEDNAKALQEELRAKGFDTSLDSAQVDSTTYFRVYVRYNQGAGLEQLLQKLKDMGLGEPLFRGVRPL